MKYWRTFLLALQTEMQYRANLVMWLIIGAIGPLSMVMVWFAILGSRSEVGGYARGDFVMYYLFFTMGWYVVGGSFCRPLANAIRDGDINKMLLKPYSIVLGSFFAEQAWKLTSLLVSIPAITLLVYFMRDYISWKMIPGQEMYFIMVLILSGIIFALLQALIGALAFWVTEIWPFAETFEVILYLFGGTLAPMSLLPNAIQRISLYLPFRYIFYEPVMMMLGNQHDPLSLLIRQGIFVVVLVIFYKLLWRAGIKRYEGIGG